MFFLFAGAPYYEKLARRFHKIKFQVFVNISETVTELILFFFQIRAQMVGKSKFKKKSIIKF